jgi:D-xylose transport system ATP-binding protein
MHDVFEVADRVTVMKNGKLVGTENVADVSQDDVLGMIILGKKPGVAA